MKVTKLMRWDGAHRLSMHDGRCARLHGHRWVAEVTVDGLFEGNGMVLDFSRFSAVQGWIDKHWDHNVLVYRGDDALIRFVRDTYGQEPYRFERDPTAEMIAHELIGVARSLLDSPVGPSGYRQWRVVRVVVWETPESSAECP